MKKDYIIFGIILVLILTLAIYFLNSNGNTKTEQTNKEEVTVKYEGVEKPIVTINVKDYGTMKLELEPTIAPNTVENFVTLANNGFYDGLTFHRIIDNFMIQGGDKEGTGAGSATVDDLLKNGDTTEYTIKAEFNKKISHVKGTISMARAQANDTASSQFFICNSDASFLDNQYSSFGRLIEGEEVLDAISKVQTDSSDYPNVPVIIESVTVDTKGVTYNVPEYITKK